jgi:hypothetical protein
MVVVVSGLSICISHGLPPTILRAPLKGGLSMFRFWEVREVEARN